MDPCMSMYGLYGMWMWAGLLGLTACTSPAAAHLELTNQSSTASPRTQQVLPDGTSLRLKLLAVYLTEDVDPQTMNNVGATSMIWLAPECHEDVTGCNVSGMASPPGPRVTQFFDLARPSEEINAELDSQEREVTPATYRYARVEMCKGTGESISPSEPTMLWRGPGMTADVPFSSNDCARTGIAFDPPLAVAPGDAVTVRLGYALEQAIVSGPPLPSPAPLSCTLGPPDPAGGGVHCYRQCVDTETSRACMEFPEFSPTAVRL